jgi:hypothetical protein
MRQASKTGLKKLYEPPKLSVYGDLSQMTKAGPTMMGNRDNGGTTGPKT